MTNRTFGWFPWVLAAVISIGVGIAAYNTGMSHGLATAAGNAMVTVPVWGPWGHGWHHWHPFGFGFFPLLFLVFFWFVIARAFFWRGGWNRPGPPAAFQDRFDHWHREAHERMNKA